MEVTLKIPDEIAAQAKARGLAVEAYIEELLSQIATQGGPNQRLRSSVEIRAWPDSLAQFSETIPPLPKIISREWIYQEHD